LIKKLSYIAER